ncbi:MAG: Motility protein B [Alphaproteobacteria bacterium ADurb.BinA280]|jgi:chemotaxis protein MotB|nr:flagellar motor protein MotD [Xanthomonadales bacterium]MCC6504965.1 flagellar motor protein MotD [Aquimonas sp.]OPZ12971.1 MAG: Motility protein B [Alphaproteobacteria bacterium ADurb.BinA280]
MARKHLHEDHINHEAWAIPYGDLLTLLLAFFVVMYSVSSLNEGKYRVASSSLNAAFGGRTTSVLPVNVGDIPAQSSSAASTDPGIHQAMPTALIASRINSQLPVDARARWAEENGVDAETEAEQKQLAETARQMEETLSSLILNDQVSVYRQDDWIEVDIKADALFASGSAAPRDAALPVLQQIAGVLRGNHHLLRIEGHTDSQPIRTLQYPSNWELSAARASSVVRLFTQQGIDPGLMQVVGYGDTQPIADNATGAGRTANRRVVLVVSTRPASDIAATGANPAEPNPTAPAPPSDASGVAR